MLTAVTWAEAGEAVIWTGGLIAAATVIVRSPPVRWLWRRNVAEPLEARLRQVVAEVVDERLDARPLTNGWGKDAVQAIAEQVGADVPPPGAPDPDPTEES